LARRVAGRLIAVLAALAAVAAVLVVAPQPAQAADRTCSGVTYRGVNYGGTFYCDYGAYAITLRDGTDQVFAIGTDYAVWTRWRNPSGGMSNWVSLGGRVDSPATGANFRRSVSGYDITVAIWQSSSWRCRTRYDSSGGWGGWYAC
jgi:hypothetical protein